MRPGDPASTEGHAATLDRDVSEAKAPRSLARGWRPSTIFRIVILVAPAATLSAGLAAYAIRHNILAPEAALAMAMVVTFILFTLVLARNAKQLLLRTTQRDEATRALWLSEWRLESAQSAANVATIDWDIVAGRAIWSANFPRVIGAPGGVKSGRSPYESFLALVQAEDRPRVDAMHLRLLKSGGAFSEEFRVERPHLGVRWVTMRGEVTRDAKGRPRRFFGSIVDITTQRADEERLRRSLSLIALANEAGEIGVWTSDGVTGVGHYDEQARAIFDWPADYDAITYKAFKSRVHPDDLENVRAIIRDALKTGEKFAFECRFLRRDGSQRWVGIRGKSDRDLVSGQSIITGIVLDATQRHEREAQLQNLLREISHRTKNLLAVIQAMARQTAIASSCAAEFQTRFAARLAGLAASHDVLVAGEWRGAFLSSIIHSQTGHIVDGMGERFRSSGPQLFLTPKAAQNVGLALHELATNAAKYGAFSNDVGSVSLSWRPAHEASGERRLHVVWAERGGPLVAARGRPGFGSAVIERVAAQALEGEATALFEPEGLTWTLKIPDRYVLSWGGNGVHAA